eukprot:100969-Amphidinium_carterae.1
MLDLLAIAKSAAQNRGCASKSQPPDSASHQQQQQREKTENRKESQRSDAKATGRGTFAWGGVACTSWNAPSHPMLGRVGRFVRGQIFRTLQ